MDKDINGWNKDACEHIVYTNGIDRVELTEFYKNVEDEPTVWRVDISKGGYFRYGTSEEFRTEDEAKAYATKWMQTHKRG